MKIIKKQLQKINEIAIWKCPTEKGAHGYSVLLKWVRFLLLPVVSIRTCCAVGLTMLSSSSLQSLTQQQGAGSGSAGAIVFTLPVRGWLDIPVFSISTHTCLLKKEVQGCTIRTSNDNSTAVTGAIFGLTESGSCKRSLSDTGTVSESR